MGHMDGLKRRIFSRFSFVNQFQLWQSDKPWQDAVKAHQQRCTDKEPRQCLLAKTLFLHSSAVSSFFLPRERPVWLRQCKRDTCEEAHMSKKRRNTLSGQTKAEFSLSLELEGSLHASRKSREACCWRIKALFYFCILSCFHRVHFPLFYPLSTSN